MIKFTELSSIHKPAGSMVLWTCVKRMADIKPHQINDGGEYLVKKTETGPAVIYRAENGKLKSTGDVLMRWGIFDDDERDFVRTR